MNPQRNDATASAQGMVFQFLVALYACFRMNEGDTVYIEKYGDVTFESIDNSDQIEVKRKKRGISNYSDEIWNTIYNWMKGKFNWESYSHLILLTTQKLMPGSTWHGWHNMSVPQRVAEFNKLLKGNSKLSKASKKRLNDIENFLTGEKKELFVARFDIDSTSGSKDDWYYCCPIKI